MSVLDHILLIPPNSIEKKFAVVYAKTTCKDKIESVFLSIALFT